MKKMLFGLILALLVPSFLISLTIGNITDSSPSSKSVNVFLVGTGVVGGALLEQLNKNSELLHEQYGIDIRVVGIANSRSMYMNSGGIDLGGWRSITEQSQEQMSWEKYLDLLRNSDLPNVIFVDCSSSQTIADSYPMILQSGVSIVTPNKKANSGSFANYRILQDLIAAKNAKFFYDSNVGAGLPILSTIDDLLKSGDQLVKIEAILSGTLSYIFNSFGTGTLFSDIVRDAQKKGYTEPDPRDDLNGMDVARKLLILAREAGIALEMKDIELQSILPADCFEAKSVDDFYIKLTSYDNLFTQIRDQAQAQGKRLLYIASFEDGKAAIRLQTVGPEHPFYHLSGNDNIAAITTKYYSKNPLVIQGPGAGADVTAAKVLQGIVRAGIDSSKANP